MLKDLGCPVDVEHGIHDICRACVMEEVEGMCFKRVICDSARILSTYLLHPSAISDETSP